MPKAGRGGAEEDEVREKEETKNAFFFWKKRKPRELRAKRVTQDAQPTPRECHRGAGRELLYYYFSFQLSSLLLSLIVKQADFN